MQGICEDPMSQDLKLRNLILYVAERSADDANLDRGKLALLLFFCDFGAHAELGESVTGARYRKLPQGPISDEWLGVRQEQPISGQSADLSLLSVDQRNLVDGVLERHRQDDATSLGVLAKAFPGYEAAFDGEEIPYHTVLIPRDGPTQADVDRGLELIRQGVLT